MNCSPLASLKHRINVGIPLPFNVRDADDTLILARGKIVSDHAQLEALFVRGAMVDVAELQKDVIDVSAARPEELPKLWTQCFEQVSAALQGSAEPGFADALRTASSPVMDLIARDPDLAVFQVLRQGASPHLSYGLNHSTHAAISCFLVAQRLGWSADEVKRAFQAALTMNLGMLELQGVLAAQLSPLTAAQRKAVHAHPQASVAILEASGITDPQWLAAVAQHHETTDGKGYPLGHRAPTEMASLLRRCDIYAAKLSPRAGRSALAADQAGRAMFMQDPGHPMSVALAKEFGVYPPGCFVKLKSGETAVVVKRGATVTAPWVATLISANGAELQAPVPRDTSGKEHAITSVVAEKSVSVRLRPELLMQMSFA